ncbi:hypothetical protein [Microbulbifer thermotolerans]|uniref:Glycosyltransferase family 1 protein n=1 Tax=Microbulbifer thermotolerans TaxID=252514 RepID=A0AB35HZJ5_MICTH|nr:hypothetical protein [Microbulbifer thermotolerans]MCX2780444.1 hypothetical protein [Microbulbifer thermotolerans]MCX2802279.1 hypothetical protein [Microbulbifer thermotolerans]MCX2805884.1 hypothetical protein [Microbulbifer thermotolerans]WKT59083.1 hypothetical protein Q2E61_09085 [Microbulbifer thermotolerans]
MKSPINVVHIASTPLVGAPGKVSECLNRYTPHNSEFIYLSDYPKPLKGSFTFCGVCWNRKSKDVSRHVLSLIIKADIIHVHNALPKPVCDEIYSLNSSASYIFQSHSGLREGPLFFDVTEMMDLPFDRYFTISQAHPRHYPSYELVPNIITYPPIRSPITNPIPRVLFSPTHTRKGRWNGKQSKLLEKVLSALSNLGKIEYIKPDTFLTPYELFSLRKRCQISIDEIITGGFHQVSLEAFCAGTVCVNGADYFSRLSLMNCLGSTDEPPFFIVTEDNCLDRLEELALSPSLVEEYQQKSLSFFYNYLKPERLIKIYVQKYEEIFQ